MRLADGPRVQCSVRVEAAVPDVWELVTDIGLPARLSPELRRVAWLDGAEGPEVGARFEGYNRNDMLGAWRTVSQVVEFDAERAFAWAVMDADGRFGDPVPDPAGALATWRFELQNLGAETLLSHSALLGPGRSGVSLAVDRWPDREEEIVALRRKALRQGMDATLRGIKALAEERKRGRRATPSP